MKEKGKSRKETYLEIIRKKFISYRAQCATSPRSNKTSARNMLASLTARMMGVGRLNKPGAFIKKKINFNDGQKKSTSSTSENQANKRKNYYRGKKTPGRYATCKRTTKTEMLFDPSVDRPRSKITLEMPGFRLV